MPYVTHLPNRTELFLVIPIRQRDEKLVTIEFLIQTLFKAAKYHRTAAG
jgi:hypothetical protein